MTLKAKDLSAAIVGIALLTGTQVIAAENAEESGFLQDYSVLSDVDTAGFANRIYLRNGVDWSAYNKLLVHDVVFFLADDAEYKGFEAQELADLATALQQAMLLNLSGPYEFTDTPGPGVIRVRMAISNLVPNNSVSGTVTTIVPIGLGLSSIKKAVTGSHIGMGQVSFEGELIDAQTGEILGAVMDTKTGKKWNLEASATTWGHVRDVFNTWAQNLRKRLDKLSGRV